MFFWDMAFLPAAINKTATRTTRTTKNNKKSKINLKNMNLSPWDGLLKYFLYCITLEKKLPVTSRR